MSALGSSPATVMTKIKHLIFRFIILNLSSSNMGQLTLITAYQLLKLVCRRNSEQVQESIYDPVIGDQIARYQVDLMNQKQELTNKS